MATPCALILTSTRDGAGAAAATTTFALEPDILVDAPIRTFEFEAKTYEWAPKTIELANPYPADCEFAVRLVNLDDADVARRDAERDAKERAAMEDAARASRAEGAGVGRDTARMSRRASSSSADRFGTGSHDEAKRRVIFGRSAGCGRVAVPFGVWHRPPDGETSAGATSRR